MKNSNFLILNKKFLHGKFFYFFIFSLKIEIFFEKLKIKKEFWILKNFEYWKKFEKNEKSFKVWFDFVFIWSKKSNDWSNSAILQDICK